MPDLKLNLPVGDEGVTLTPTIPPVVPPIVEPIVEPTISPVVEPTVIIPPVVPISDTLEEKIMIDDIEYIIDKDGNAITPKGDIFKTKVELESLVAVEDNLDVDDPITIIQEVLNFKPEINGKPVVYDRTKEGLTKLTLDAANEIGKVIAEQEISNYFKNNPDVAQSKAYKTIHGSLENYVPETDWSKVDITTLTDEQLSSIITYERKAKGDSDEITTYFVSGLKDEKLKEFAAQSIKFLNDRQIANIEAAKQIEDNKKANEALLIDNYWKSVNSSLSAKKITVNNETFNIPDSFTIKEESGKTIIKTIKDFDKYIKTPLSFVIDGKTTMLTQNQYDILVEESKHNSDTDIFNALRRFLHYDDTQLVNNKVRQEQIKEIRKYISKSAAKSDTEVSSNDRKLKFPV